MAWAWCLPTGWNTPITYYYVIYFGILLAHRQNRDDEACKAKYVLIDYNNNGIDCPLLTSANLLRNSFESCRYGKDWDKYCKIVKWKIIPGLY